MARDTEKVKGESPDRVKRFFDLYAKGVPTEGIASEGFGTKEQEALIFIAGCSNKPFLHRPTDGGNGHSGSYGKTPLPASKPMREAVEEGPAAVAKAAMKPEALTVPPVEPATSGPRDRTDEFATQEYPATITLPDGRSVPNPVYRNPKPNVGSGASEGGKLSGEETTLRSSPEAEPKPEYTLVDHTEMIAKEEAPYTLADHPGWEVARSTESQPPQTGNRYEHLTEEELLVLRNHKLSKIVGKVSNELVARPKKVQEPPAPIPSWRPEKSPAARGESQSDETTFSQEDEAPGGRVRTVSRPFPDYAGRGPTPGYDGVSSWRVGAVVLAIIGAVTVLAAGFLGASHRLSLPSIGGMSGPTVMLLGAVGFAGAGVLAAVVG